jgi:hypothetical protein
VPTGIPKAAAAALAVWSRKMVSCSTCRCEDVSWSIASATATRSTVAAVWSSTGRSAPRLSPVSAGRARRRRCSSMTIRRATADSHGISDGPEQSRRPASRQARSMVSWTTSSARCRSPPVSRSTNTRSGARYRWYSAVMMASSSPPVTPARPERDDPPKRLTGLFNNENPVPGQPLLADELRREIHAEVNTITLVKINNFNVVKPVLKMAGETQPLTAVSRGSRRWWRRWQGCRLVVRPNWR